jgi:hypothetical protein
MRTEYLDDTENVICPYCKHGVLIQEDLTPPDPCECVIYIGTNEGGFEDVTPERYKKRFCNETTLDIEGITDCSDIEGIRMVVDSFNGFRAYYGFEKPKAHYSHY